MQPQKPQELTRAQTNAVRTTCTSCHQRKVKCDAHDRGFPCTRCRKSRTAADCCLHRKSRRVSRAKREAIKAQHGTAKNLPPRPVAIASSTTLAVSSRGTSAEDPLEKALDTIVAAGPSTPGSLFLQTVIAEEGKALSPQVAQRPSIQPSLPLKASVHPLQRIKPGVYQSQPQAQPLPPQVPVRRPVTAPDAPTPQSDHSAALPGHGVDGEYKKYLVEFIDQPSLIDRPIDRDSRTLYVGSPLSNLHFLLRQRVASGSTSDGKHVTERFLDGVVHYSATRFSKSSFVDDGLPLEAFQLPPKRTVDQLLTAYFTHINPGFPVVDEDVFMHKYRARDPKNPPSFVLLQAVLVAGAHALYRNEDAETRDGHKAVYFRRAKMLMDARFERNRDNVVQAALLMTWHVDGPEDAAANAWHWVGLAARTAMGLGMHRHADGCTLVPSNKRMWRRIWWLLFQCDVLVSLQYGRPPAIHLEDCDVRPLTASDMQDCGPNTSVDYILQMTDLCILLSRDVLRTQFQSPSAAAAAAAAAGMTPEEARRAALRRTDEALAHWSLQLPPSLQLNSGGHNSSRILESSLNVWTASLHLTYNTVLMLLHRQATMPATGTANSDDIEICTNAAVAVQQIFESVCASDQVASLWSSSINSLFTAMIQLSWEVRRSAVRRASLSQSMGIQQRKIGENFHISQSGGNPLLAVAALRRYDSALSSLRQLATFWANAQAIVQFFEQSVRLEGDTAATTTETAEAFESTENTDGMDIASEQAATELPEAEIPTDRNDKGLSSAAVDVRAIPEPTTPDMTQLMSMGNPTLPFEGIAHPHPPPLADPWSGHDYWQRIYWQPPETADDFLFSF
ncbi:acetamidase regulatory protein [Ophiostoma piceae UAMH 11346]|uniref:Acetamidase regulatory protein n=1 Tax=Ophiostoma piceae (strain UAMH 11346) TaxID=1262450 RepID=S3CK47_OPHP1|nr:acetamidase regulatory protein [Ophiostoma piceae UAMH 11346]